MVGLELHGDVSSLLIKQSILLWHLTYAGLVIMGGDRAIERLQKKAHTQRFINSFDRVEKPILAINGASEIVSGLSASLINTEENKY